MKLLILLLSLITSFQNDSFWKTLEDVSYKSKEASEGFEIPYPVFGEKLKEYSGKEIHLKGYIIPLEKFGGKGYFMFSSLPFNSCFFCGGAGPETVVEAYYESKIDYTSKLITVKGILQLNDSDPDHHMYILKDVKQVY